MYLWSTFFETLGPFSRVPRLLWIASEERSDHGYHLKGRFRQRERHALFKYTLSGTGGFRDRSGEHRLPPEHGFLCEVCDPGIEYFYPPEAKAPWTFMFITFDGESALQWTRDLIRQSGPIFHLPRSSGIIQQMHAAEKGSRDHRVIQAVWGAEFVLSLLLTLTRSREAGASADDSGGLVHRVQEFVANNLDRNINGKHIADTLHVSREHLSRVFRKRTGTTLHAYILQRKMDYASHLLKHSDFNSKEIANQLGYESPAHFARTFRRVKAITPGRFKATGLIS